MSHLEEQIRASIWDTRLDQRQKKEAATTFIHLTIKQDLEPVKECLFIYKISDFAACNWPYWRGGHNPLKSPWS